jgi:hypothetical protein
MWNGLKASLVNFAIEVGSDGMRASIGRLDVVRGDEPLISLDFAGAPFLSAAFPDVGQELATFDGFPDGPDFNALKVSVDLPHLALRISKALMDSIVDISDIFTSNFKPAPPRAVRPSKSSLFVELRTKGVALTLDNFRLSVMNPRFAVYQTTTAADSLLRSVIDVESVRFDSSPSNSVVRSLSNPSCSVKVAVDHCLGKDAAVSLDCVISAFLLRIPSDLSIFDPLVKLVPKTEPEPVAASPRAPICYSVNVLLHRPHIDYVTLAMPARAIVILPRLRLTCKGTPPNLQGTAQASLEAYLSNVRAELPVSVFQKPEFPAPSFQFARIISVDIDMADFCYREDCFFVRANRTDVSLTFCLDSARVFAALMGHIQYKLDLPPERQTPVRRFDLPTRLLDLTQTLMQSLNVPSIGSAPSRTPAPRVFDTMEQLIGSVRLDREDDAPPDDPGGNDLLIESAEPQSKKTAVVQVSQLDIDVRFMGGRDFPEIWDLRTLDDPPPVLEEAGDDPDCEFEIVTNRDEFNYIQLRAVGVVHVSVYDNDPAVSTRILLSFSEFDVLDNIQESASRVLFGIDEDGAKLVVQVDVLASCQNRMELSIRLALPKMSMFVTHEQILFFVACASAAIPVFPADLIVDEPLAFQLFSIRASKLHISAHFRLWLDVHLDDIDIAIPDCTLFAIRGFDGLVGSLVEFYFAELNRPHALAVIGGLPVVKNLRRITGAVRDLFTFDIQKYGVAMGFGKSFGALMQIVAMETLNAGANATTIAERFLGIAMNILNGKDVPEGAMRNGLATLIVQAKAEKDIMKKIPTIVLAPGILSLQKLNEHIKGLRDRLNPKFAKQRNRYRK